MGTPAPVALGKLGIGPADPVTILLNVEGFTPGYRRELKDANKTNGAYERDGNRTTPGRTYIQPRLASEPTASELQTLLAWGMYGTPTGTTTKTYPLANAVNAQKLLWFPNNGDSWFIQDCGVDVMTISASEAGNMRVEIEAVAKTADNSKVSFPALTPDQTYRPYILQHLALTLGGVSKNVRDFRFRISHGIDKERFLNSPTLTDLVPLRREITMAVSVPSGDNSGFYDDGLSGVAVVATFTNASGSALVMTFPDWRFPAVSPEFGQDQEGFLTLEGELYRGPSAATPTVITSTL